MSEENRGNGDIERYSSTRIESTHEETNRSTTAVRNSGQDGLETPTNTSPDSIADAVSGRLSQSQSVTVETASTVATLVGVPKVDISEFVFNNRGESGDQRSVALFDIENTSDQPLRWQSTRTQFIGDDEYTYSPSRTSLDPQSLGPGCHTRQVELQPGTRARVVTLVEELPPGVKITEVIQTVSAGIGTAGNERLVFSL